MNLPFTLPHSQQEQHCDSDQLVSHLQPNNKFCFMCFDSVLACFYCSSHSCISTRLCEWQKCNSSIRLQGVCWESQISLKIYALHQIIVTDTTLPASQFGNTRISPCPSPPPLCEKAKLERARISHRYHESCSHRAHGGEVSDKGYWAWTIQKMDSAKWQSSESNKKKEKGKNQKKKEEECRSHQGS